MTLAARATDAKICLWQIKHRRVQTAAVGLCRGVYVFIGRVEAGSMIGNMSYNSRGDALTTVYGFLRGLLMYLQPEYNCISRETVSYTSRGTIPHIVTNYHRAYIQRRTEHFRGCLQTPVLNPPKADFSIRCACNQTRVCRRKCSVRRPSKRECAGGSVLSGGYPAAVLIIYSDYRISAFWYFLFRFGLFLSAPHSCNGCCRP